MIEPPRKGYVFRACVTSAHKWHALCACGASAVCLRCGIGQGAIPCACQVPRWGDAALVTRTMEREQHGE